MRLANLASGVVVMENGAVPCSRTALQAALLAERANAEVALGRQGAPT
jgi:bifunctional ADP-heptose synthase (sugar kinase/adenylyltransferase)